MRRTRILFVVPQLDAGGSERVVLDLARCLGSDKFDVFVVAFKGGVLADHLKNICKEIIILKKKPGLDISAIFKLAKFVRRLQIDVVNAHHYMPCFYSFWGSRVLCGKKLVYTEHSVAEVENIVRCAHNRIFQGMLYGINGVIGVSRAIAGTFKESFPRHAAKFHAVINGVDIDKFQAKGMREVIRTNWGMGREHFVVGTVANFRKIKNHVCLVRAAGRLKDSHPQLRLLFVGAGFSGDAENSEGEVRKTIRELGLQERVVLAGYQENIPDLLSSFDAFCLPSFSEGLPVSLLEAMAARLPVIGSEVTGIVEVVANGKTGMLFPSNNDEALSHVLENIIDSPGLARSLADNGFSFVEHCHGFKAWQEEYSRFLTAQ